MKIFIDSDFKLHTSNPEGTFREVETADERGNDFFSDKCGEFIEGYRYVPFGESWTRFDGTVFHGEMIAPWKDYSELDEVQREYERQKLENCLEALQELGVET